MEKLTIVSAYFNQPEIFEEWWRVLLSYPDELAAKIQLCLVDDHSRIAPLHIPVAILDKFEVQAFRVEDDIPWNQPGARNLAMRHVGGWCYMTDPDYILYPEEAQKLFGEIAMARAKERWRGQLEKGNFYHLNSVLYPDGRKLNRPLNIAVLHTEDFWDAGGYDERFSGNYGFDDVPFWRGMREVVGATNVFIDAKMVHYPKGIIETKDGRQITDAATSLKRDTTRNQQVFKKINAEIALKGWKRFLRDRPSLVRFKWRRFA